MTVPRPPIDGIVDAPLEQRTVQGLITAAWWLRELAGELPHARAVQARLVAGDLTKIIDECLRRG